ncbi:unnamed protein product [Coregonus sp. 'balchen']|nr:unnamed protein product [Coregonus sp. 'balchen']
MITNHFLGLLMLSILQPINALPVAPGNTVNLLGTLPEKDDGRILQRSKRGWMWNQFFLLEEYTGNDNQYVGKIKGVTCQATSVSANTETASRSVRDNATVIILREGNEVTVDSQFSQRKLAFITCLILRSKQVSLYRVEYSLM